MFDNEDDDDLFLSDIGSLSQIYGKEQHIGKNFKANFINRGTGKPNSNVLAKDKNGKPFVLANSDTDKLVEQNAPQNDLVSGDVSSNINLYDDDEDIKISDSKMTTKEAYSDDRIYDDFELSTNPSEPEPVDSLPKAKNDAPWLNREKVPENDSKRLLEYERSFKKDQFADDGYPRKSRKQYPTEIENRAKTARSLQRKQIEFDQTYSKWAYDDQYDNEDKSDDKDNAAYDPEQAYSETSTSRLFNRERFANPETPYNELLDENYPNAGDLRPYKVGKIRVENKLEEKLKASLKEPKTPRVTKSEDEDVIILDDTLPTNARIRNEVNKKIKISFNAEHKLKSVPTESAFNDDNSPNVRTEPITETPQPVRTIPVLETSNIPIINPTPTNIRPITPGAPIISSTTPVPHFSNAAYSMMERNYYSSFGGNVINEMHANRNFIPEATSSEFYSASTAPPGTFAPTVGWIPVNPSSAPVAAAVIDKVPNTKEAPKADKVTGEDAVKEEIRQQNKTLMDQRDQYLQKFNSLNEELTKLKKQKKTLVDKKSHQAEEFLRENNKLQNEIANKIKAVKNIIDMLSKIIKDAGMMGSSESTDEGSKKNSVEGDDSAKDHAKKKRKHSRSRSKSRHRSRSRSRSRRSRSRSRHRSRSRSRSPRSRYRRRSRSRDKYYRRRRSPSRDRKKNKRDKEKTPSNTTTSVPTPAPAPAVVDPPPPAVVENTPVVEKPKDTSLSDRFKSSFEEIHNRPIEPPKAPEVQKHPVAGSRFGDKPKSIELPINAIPAVPPTLEKVKPTIQQPVMSKGWARGTADTVNYVHFDPEIHWCRVCNVFPKTAKEYLLHLHAPEHKQVLATNNLIDYPWHKNQIDTKKTTTPGAPTERIPIRGLPFFVSAAAWYCKLCDQWMGDLHCASAHLKSDEHENNYMTFLESNPKWEEHWVDSREKAHKALHVVKAPELVTPAYSTETYVKPTPIPPPPPPLKLRAGSEKKRSSSTSSSSSSSSSSSTSSSSARDSYKKKKKSKRSKDRKRSVEKDTKFKMVVTDAKRARELAKKQPVAPAPQPEPASAPTSTTVSFNVEEEDKFVQEWMNTVRSKSKEKDFQELKNKLSKKKEPMLPAPPPTTEKNKMVFDTDAKKPPPNRRSPERDRSRRDDDYRGGGGDRQRSSRFEDRRRSPRDDRYKRSNGSDSRSSDKYKGSGDRGFRDGKSGSTDASRRSEGSASGGTTKKTIIDRRFPFIGKMPSKNTFKKSGEQTEAKVKSPPKVEPVPTEPAKPVQPIDPVKPADPAKPSDPLTESIQKQLAEYDRPNDVDVAVVDMDINEDEDEPVSIVVDDNISRKKDFDETLKLLYPEDKPKSGSQAIAGLPANLSQDYLVSLIRSTIKEKQLTLNEGNETSQILEIASSMKEILFNNTNVADIPIPIDERPVHISSEEQLYNVPLPEQPAVPGVEEEPEPAPPGTAEDTDAAAIKKKKNPISQKKRKHLRKIREKLEEQEKLLQQKIEECTSQTEPDTDGDVSASALVSDSISASSTADETVTEPEPSSPTPRPINVMDSDLMMLGIDEDDSAALLF